MFNGGFNNSPKPSPNGNSTLRLVDIDQCFTDTRSSSWKTVSFRHLIAVVTFFSECIAVICYTYSRGSFLHALFVTTAFSAGRRRPCIYCRSCDCLTWRQTNDSRWRHGRRPRLTSRRRSVSRHQLAPHNNRRPAVLPCPHVSRLFQRPGANSRRTDPVNRDLLWSYSATDPCSTRSPARCDGHRIDSDPPRWTPQSVGGARSGPHPARRRPAAGAWHPSSTSLAYVDDRKTMPSLQGVTAAQWVTVWLRSAAAESQVI